MNRIAVVDLSPLTSSTNGIAKEEVDLKWKIIAKEIGAALHEFGFVYIINHGLDRQKITTAFEESKLFFNQNMETKFKYKRNNATKGYHGGYSLNNTSENSAFIQSTLAKNPQETEKKSPVEVTLPYDFELRESFDYTGRSGVYPNDDINSNFHNAMLRMENECKPLVKIIFKIIGLALELEDPDYFLNSSKWIDDPSVPSFKTFRSLFYPAIPEDIEIPEGKFRVKEHSDFDFFTILLQDMIGGLEIKSMDEKWIPATPIEDSVLINIGDMLDIWTGGYFPATKHRVLVPQSEIKKRTSRQSIVYFVHPDSRTIMSPLSSNLLNLYNFEPLTAYQHAKMKLAAVNSY